MSRAPHILAAVAVVGALAVPAAFGAANGLYKGHTIGDTSEDVTVKVKNGRVKRFVAHAYGSCGYSNLLLTVAYPPAGAKKGTSAKIRDNGSFRAVFKGSPDVEDDKRTITGKFRGSKVTGTIKVEGLCSIDEKYSAKR